MKGCETKLWISQLDFDGTHQMLREAQGMTKDLTEVTETGAEREKDIKPLQLACGDNHV